MSAFGSFLASAAGPIAKRVLTSLGIGVVSFAALNTVTSQLISSASQAWSGAAGDLLPFLAMSGANTAASIIAGAITARVSLLALKRLDIIR